MSLELITGPPGSGKTRRLIEAARELCLSGRRVLWIGLPAQRNSVLRRVVAEGGVVGFEFVTEQQFCYRLLSRARLLRPLRVGTERLALVGAALAEVRSEVPLPGEARLFSAAIAELKRHGQTPADAAALAADPESERLATVYQAYETIKGEAWDYDDYRSQALKLAADGAADPGVDALFVAGYRELLPMASELYGLLAEKADVRLALPQEPQGLPQGTVMRTVLPAPEPVTLTAFRAPNEIEEFRWVLRAVKAELAGGADMADLALVAPVNQLAAFSALAEEYQVPLMPETPATLAESRAGRTLLELIRLQDFTGPSALLALPGLERLAAAALDRRISGVPALLRLAARLDEQALLDAEEVAAEAQEPSAAEPAAPPVSHRQLLLDWLNRLEEGNHDLDWAERLTELVAGEIMPARASGGDFDAAAFMAQALQRAREAAQLGKGQSFRAWWAALLEETHLPAREPAGVALLSPQLTSGRRYRKAWLAGALEGAYVQGGSEDYFLPEELRQSQAAGTGLPRRFTGQEALVFQELLQLADEITVTFAASSQGGRNTAQLELLGDTTPGPLPELPAGSRFELAGGSTVQLTHDLEPSLVQLPTAEAEWLPRYGACPHRAWAEDLLRRSGDLPDWELLDWQQLRRDIVRSRRLTEADLDALATAHPWAADWLASQRELLTDLHYGLRLPPGETLQSRIDASGRLDGVVSIFRLCGPGTVKDAGAARELLRNRVAERYLASRLLERVVKPEPLVRLFAWPILGEPIEAGAPGGVDQSERWVRAGLANQLDGPREDHGRGVVTPRPGYMQCGNCSVFDFCRKGINR